MKKESKLGTIVIIVILLAIIALFGKACGGDEYTAQDLQDAKERYFFGTPSDSDKRMVEGFYKWKANN